MCDARPNLILFGEALRGEGNAVGHIDLAIGNREGHMGPAMLNALSRQSRGHSILLAGTPNLIVKPPTLTVTKVTIQDGVQAGRMFGVGQDATAKAIADELEAGTFNLLTTDPEKLGIICAIFIHWDANAQDDENIFRNNYWCVRTAIQRAAKGEPTAKQVIDGRNTKHVFAVPADPTKYAETLALMRGEFVKPA